MADRKFWMQFLKAAGNELRRPAVFDSAPDISANFLILEPLVCSAGNSPTDGPFMRFVGQIIARVNRRGIAFELS